MDAFLAKVRQKEPTLVDVCYIPFRTGVRFPSSPFISQLFRFLLGNLTPTGFFPLEKRYSIVFLGRVLVSIYISIVSVFIKESHPYGVLPSRKTILNRFSRQSPRLGLLLHKNKSFFRLSPSLTIVFVTSGLRYASPYAKSAVSIY